MPKFGPVLLGLHATVMVQISFARSVTSPRIQTPCNSMPAPAPMCTFLPPRPASAGPRQPAGPVAGHHPAGHVRQRAHGAARAVDARLGLAHRLHVGLPLLWLGPAAQVGEGTCVWAGGDEERLLCGHVAGSCSESGALFQAQRSPFASRPPHQNKAPCLLSSPLLWPQHVPGPLPRHWGSLPAAPALCGVHRAAVGLVWRHILSDRPRAPQAGSPGLSASSSLG